MIIGRSSTWGILFTAQLERESYDRKYKFPALDVCECKFQFRVMSKNRENILFSDRAAEQFFKILYCAGLKNLDSRHETKDTINDKTSKWVKCNFAVKIKS